MLHYSFSLIISGSFSFLFLDKISFMNFTYFRLCSSASIKRILICKFLKILKSEKSISTLFCLSLRGNGSGETYGSLAASLQTLAGALIPIRDVWPSLLRSSLVHFFFSNVFLMHYFSGRFLSLLQLLSTPQCDRMYLLLRNLLSVAQ